MFWKKKKSEKKKNIRTQASKIAADKRAEIGEDTLNEIRSAIMARKNSPLEKAKRQIAQANQDKVRDNIRFWLDEK
ncbi:MAG: hypothetical protein MRY79_06320 [Alphaproteobacteria bacterium]|nr:hypothetical protein [Alphaproteobacteria bacterium]